jgi:hypothetical protein
MPVKLEREKIYYYIVKDRVNIIKPSIALSLTFVCDAIGNAFAA